MDKQHTRCIILEEALKLAPFEGWTMSMLRRATTNAHASFSDLTRVFDNNPLKALEFWTNQLDASMNQGAQLLALCEMKIRERIFHIVMLRLQLMLPHKEAVRRATRVLMFPWNTPLQIKFISKTVDHIWKLAGDTSHDYNWYSKRLLLTGVYGSTLVYWLNDDSIDMSATRYFLQKRIDQVLKLGGGFSKLTNRVA